MKHSIAKSAVLITLISILSKFTGFLREMFLASNFGASKELDSFLTAETIIAFLSTMLLTVLGVILVPLISRYVATKSKSEVNHLLNKVYSNILLISLLIMAVGFFFTYELVLLFAPDFDYNLQQVTVNLTKLLLPSLLFTIIIFLNNNILQSHRIYYVSAAIAIPLNLIIISYLIIGSSNYGIEGLAIIIVVGTLVQVFFQIPFIKKMNYNFRFEIDSSHFVNIRLFKNLLPVLLGSTILQFYSIIEKSIASSLQVGSITALSLAYMLIMFVTGIITSSVSTVYFTELSIFHINKEQISFNSLFVSTINIIIIIVIPISIGLIILRYPITEILFLRGKFNVDATILTSNALLYYSIGLVGYSMREILNRTLFVLKVNNSYLVSTILFILSFFTFSLFLTRMIGTSGLALGNTVAVYLNLLYLIYSIRKFIYWTSFKNIFVTFNKSLFSSLIMGFVTYGAFYLIGSNFPIIIKLLVSTSLSIITYGIILKLLKVKELEEMINKVSLGKLFSK